MKRFLLIVITVLLAAALVCCAQPQEPEEELVTEEYAEPVYTAAPEEPPIAVLMNGQTRFNETFVQSVQPQIEAAGYRALVYYSESDTAQVDDMYAAIGEGAKSIAILPADMDNLHQVLDETDLQGIPIVNLMVPINGRVQTLVCPDYAEMGRMAAQAAQEARPEGASVLMVDNVSSSLVAQLKRDGFLAGAEETGTVDLAEAVLVDGTEEQVKERTAQALASNNSINVVFSTEEHFLDGVLAAVSEAGRDVSVIAVGGGSVVLDAVENGSVYASVFASPVELAEIAVGYMISLAGDSKAAVEEFAQVKLETISQRNLAEYRAKDGYADILTPATPMPLPTEEVPQETPKAEDEQQQEGAEDAQDEEQADE
ncbi:sugar ABC transporter substrate-binding protein [Christensenellaceae bacterium OttesenSCG-928-K19]|nr:sugar ABC transporter substrate-binding protein [Christensenellaceae bacterium OttesenSCG-928-K19]